MSVSFFELQTKNTV